MNFFGLSSKRRRGTTCPTVWTQQTSSFTGTTWIDWVHYGNGNWVAGGAGGKIATSSDGASWTQRTSGFGADTIRGGTYGSSVHVNVGSAGKLFTASDPTSTWTSRTSGFGASAIYDCSYDGSTNFVICGDTAKLSTATDPTSTWTSRTSNFGSDIFAAEYGNSIWVIVGGTSGGDTKAATATDPTGTWTSRTIVGSDAGVGYGVAYGNGIWVVVGIDASGDPIIYTATDPTSTWTSRTPTGFASGQPIFEVAFGNGCFCAVGGVNSTVGKISTSTDGITWTERTSSFGVNSIYGIAYDGTSRWVSTGHADKIATSDVV